MENFKKKFGKRLQEIRKGQKKTQAELAEAVGVDPKYISRIESGVSSPSFEMITKLSDALGLTPDYLFKFEHIESKEVLIDTINNKLETFDLEKIKLIARIIDDIII